MALLDKLGSLMENVAGKTVEIAEAAADKTQSFAEIAKLNGRIAEENSRITALKLSLSSAVYGRYERGETVDEEFAGYCRLIEECLNSIAGMQSEIAHIKGEPARTQTGAAPVVAVCPGCGKPQTPDTKFCPDCGMRMDGAPAPTPEPPAPEPPAPEAPTEEEPVE